MGKTGPYGSLSTTQAMSRWWLRHASKAAGYLCQPIRLEYMPTESILWEHTILLSKGLYFDKDVCDAYRS